MPTDIERLDGASFDPSPLGTLADPKRCVRVGDWLVAIAGTDERTLVRAELAAPTPTWVPIAEDVVAGDSVGPVALADARHGRLLVASLRSAWLLELAPTGAATALREWTLHSESSTPLGISLSADASGDVLAMVEREHLHRMSRGSSERRSHYEDPPFSRVCVAPDGRVIATARVDGRVQIRDATSLRVVRELEGLGATVLALAFSPDGRAVAAADDRTRAFVWDVASGAPRRLEGVAKIVHLAWTTDGSGLLAVSLTRHVAAWDLADTHASWTPRSERHFHELGTRYFLDAARIDASRIAVVLENGGVLSLALGA